MKRLVSVLTIFILLTCVTSAQTVDEILSNYFETIGQENLLQKNTLIAKGKLLQGQIEIPFTAIQKRPSNMKMEATLQGMTLKQAYDGKSGWSINPFMGQTEPSPMTQEQLDQMVLQADFDGPYYNYEEKGYTVELVEPDTLDDIELYGLKLIQPNGDAVTTYFDSENYVPLKSVSKTNVQGVETEAETYFSNYKEVEGIYIPFEIETKVNGQTMITMVFDEIKYGEEVDDSIFEMPKVEEPADSTEQMEEPADSTEGM